MVKVQVHIDNSDRTAKRVCFLKVYNKDRTINGTMAINTGIGAKIFSMISMEDIETETSIWSKSGYFWALEKKGDEKGNLYIISNLILDEQSWW